jgi:hypothetical protein
MRTRHTGAVGLVLLCAAFRAPAADSPDVALGFHLMLGGRYDNLRMCVAAPAGVKGGPVADLMLDVKFGLGDGHTVGINLPVMRPILFGLAFKMLQFEPQVFYESSRKLTGQTYLVAGPGLGVSLHYGPDYKSDAHDRTESFFAAGPYVSGLVGLNFMSESMTDRIVGLRAFYVPLFSREHGAGTVVGGALEGHLMFR